MNFNYRKNDNSPLFKNLEDVKLLNIEKIQNYIPIYKKFFDKGATLLNIALIFKKNIILVFL